MYTIKILIIAVLIAVTDAKEGYLKGAISEDLELKPADILSSLSAEFTKSDVEITLGGRAAEDVPTDAIDANDDSRNDKNQETAGERKSEHETVGVNSPEETQKITHTSDVNASFIHVKEKIARQSSAEEYGEGDELQRDADSEEFIDRGEPKNASDDLRKAEETLSSEVPERRSFDKKEVEASEKSGPAGADDTQDQFELDTDGEDDDLPTQSRRMLSFDPKLLDAVNIPKMIESEPLLELRSGQNDYKLHTPGVHDYDHGHYEHHIGETDNRRGYAPETNPLPFSPSNIPLLPPIALFRSSGQPQHPHSQFPGNTERHPDPVDNNLQNPGFTNNFNENPHFDRQHDRQFKPPQQLFPHPLEQIKPVQTLQQFHLPQIQHKPSFQLSQPSQLLTTFQSLQPSRSFHSFESWQPLQTSRSMNPQTSVATSSSAVTAFQPSQMQFTNILPSLRDASQNPVHTEMSNQFSGVVHRNWNWSV